MRDLDEELSQELRRLESIDRLRLLRPSDGPNRTILKESSAANLVSFCSNDYLGLSTHPLLRAAARGAIEQIGTGPGASRLVAGDFSVHRALEAAFSRHVGAAAALSFPTGYQANLGVLTALAGPGDLIVSDAANHASIIDACRLSRADVRIYRHADLPHAREALTNGTSSYRRILLVTESVFSMDGDAAPLGGLAELCQQAGAHLIVDEAHAVGTMGPHGAGLSAAEGIRPAALIGTLGKAIGASGGIVAGSETLRSYLVNRARTFIFTTALSPAAAAAATAAIELIGTAEGEILRTSLAANLAALDQALAARSPPFRPHRGSPIRPLILGSDAQSLAAAAFLRTKGCFVAAIRPPTVPEGTARLRITMSAAHTADQVQALCNALTALPSAAKAP